MEERKNGYQLLKMNLAVEGKGGSENGFCSGEQVAGGVSPAPPFPYHTC